MSLAPFSEQLPAATSRRTTFIGSLLLFGAGLTAGLAATEFLGWNSPPLQTVNARPGEPILETKPREVPTISTTKVGKQETTRLVVKQNLREGVEAVIEASPDGLFWATPRIVGREVRFLVQPGQTVRQGTPLLVQDHPGANVRELAEQDRREALLNLTITKRRCELADRELARAEQAGLSANTLDRLRVEAQVAKDRCDTAQQLVKKAELNEEIATFERDLKIVESPFAGLVLKVEGARGLTTPNGVGVCVLDPELVLAPCLVSASVAKTLDKQTKVTVSPVARPTEIRSGKISGATPRLLSANKFDEEFWNVWIEIRQREGEEILFPGQRVVVRFPELRAE